MTNRFIKTYQRMNGPLQDNYYAQQKKKLPKIEYKVNNMQRQKNDSIEHKK